MCNYLFRPLFFCGYWSLKLLLRVLTYSESIFNRIIMIILDVGIGYDLCGLDCQRKEKKKSTGTLRCLSHALDSLGFGA